jgi:hypothetical protein
MTEDRNVSALFELKSHTLSLVAPEGGSVSGSGQFDHGKTVPILATPNTGYSFTEWDDPEVTETTAASTTVLISEDRNITALFSLNSYKLNLHASEGGTVAGDGQFDYGTNRLITANPSPGYSFSGWSGLGVSEPTAASTTVLMSEDRNLTATFALQQLSTLPETENLGDGWHSTWFGFFLQTESGWCFHHELQWIYPFVLENDGVWFWTTSLGWLWTDSFPWGQSQCWSESLQSWLYFQADHRQGSSFISYQSKEVIPLQ